MSAIHLVRHGHSAYVHGSRWVNGNGAREFEQAYNSATIRDDSLPPPELIETASRAGVVACSDMIRAIDSARRLAPARAPEIVPALRELTLDIPPWLGVRMPVEVWDIMSYTLWSYRLWAKSDHETVRRANEAVGWLFERANGGTDVVAVTHGGFRRLLEAQILARGWYRVAGPRTYANWSCWVYSPRR